jgi:guanosine-3',5'-bis(diphosphate) 3'-pyrophosphohydrolase
VDVLQAAVLHDTVEDTDATPADIEAAFGARVAQIVAECTDDRGQSREARKEAQVQTAPHKSRAAKLVKLADKLYNLRDLVRSVPAGWDAARVQEYFVWARRVVDGCRGANAALEARLDELFDHGVFVHDGTEFKCIPSNPS